MILEVGDFRSHRVTTVSRRARRGSSPFQRIIPSKAQLILSKSTPCDPGSPERLPMLSRLVNPAARLSAKVSGGGSSHATWASAQDSGPERRELPSPRFQGGLISFTAVGNCGGTLS